MNRFKRAAAAAFLLSALGVTQAEAQETGRIIGRVLDATSAQPLANAQVYLGDGSSGVGSLSDLNGRFVLPRVPVGTVAVTAQQLGYATKSVTEVRVTANQTTTLDVALEQSAVEVEGIVITSAREEGRNAFLLDQLGAL